ncbi:MAG: FkbM family methyltransferase [Phycisphaerales bacterium]
MTKTQQTAASKGPIGKLATIASDAAGIARVCGPGVALKWLLAIARHAPEILKSGNLQAADIAMGSGPYRCKLGNARATLRARKVISGIREIWVRNVYLQSGFLTINDNDQIVDLGCNKGNFTILALAHGPGVRSVSVEVKQSEIERLNEQLSQNGFQDRVQIVHAFIGRDLEQSEKLREAVGGNTTLAEVITEDELIQRCNIQRIDLLKCDIEGSEFDLLTPDSRLLAMTKQLAIEVHKDIGDAEAFIGMLHSLGFETRRGIENNEAVVISARRTLPAT